jgi:hypothetical protein
MNQNPARPKPVRVIMAPCTCASRYAECNCEWLRSKSLGAKPGVAWGWYVVFGFCGVAALAGYFLR